MNYAFSMYGPRSHVLLRSLTEPKTVAENIDWPKTFGHLIRSYWPVNSLLGHYIWPKKSLNDLRSNFKRPKTLQGQTRPISLPGSRSTTAGCPACTCSWGRATWSRRDCSSAASPSTSQNYPSVSRLQGGQKLLQSGTSYLSQGFEDNVLGGSSGW